MGDNYECHMIKCLSVCFIYYNGDRFSMLYQILEKAVGARWILKEPLDVSKPNMEHESQEVSSPLSLSLTVTVRAAQYTRGK